MKGHYGVDGSKLYMYGEGWDYAEIADNRVGVNASQKNLAGAEEQACTTA